MEELSIIELKCNEYDMVFDVTELVAGATYSYKFYNVIYDDPELYTPITMDSVSDTTVKLLPDVDGVWLLEVVRSVEGVDDVISYNMIVSMCALENCRQYMLQQLLCGDNRCHPRHDCNNCKQTTDTWNIRLSEMNMMFYELQKYIVKYGNILEETLDADEDLIKVRIKDIVEKIGVMVEHCTSCTDCTDTRRRCPNC